MLKVTWQVFALEFTLFTTVLYCLSLCPPLRLLATGQGLAHPLSKGHYPCSALSAASAQCSYQGVTISHWDEKREVPA